MVKNYELDAAPQISLRSEESGTDPPSPGHTDDEASDEEEGQAQLVRDDGKMNVTAGQTRQAGLH